MLGWMNAEEFADRQLHTIDLSEKSGSRSVVIASARFDCAQIGKLPLEFRDPVHCRLQFRFIVDQLWSLPSNVDNAAAATIAFDVPMFNGRLLATGSVHVKIIAHDHVYVHMVVLATDRLMGIANRLAVDVKAMSAFSRLDQARDYPLELGCSRRAVDSRLDGRYSSIICDLRPLTSDPSSACSKPFKMVSAPRSKRCAGKAS
jgi:hypothetical protein